MHDYAPILVTAFNRPQSLEKVLRSIMDSTSRIYVALDAAKENDQINLKKVEECKNVIRRFESRITKLKISQFNQGCYRGVTNAINWAFEREESLIILEDDIIIDSNFIKFATELLRLYESDTRIGGISAMNMVPKNFQTNPQADYRFTMYTSSWGWATWRNRWVNFEHVIEGFEDKKLNWPTHHWSFWNSRYWKKIFEGTMTPESDSWAYRWQYSNWKHQKFTIVPNYNLSLNIGFGDEATHTFDRITPWWLPREITQLTNAGFESISVERDLIADGWMEDNHYRMKSIHQIKNYIRRTFPFIVNFLRKEYN